MPFSMLMRDMSTLKNSLFSQRPIKLLPINLAIRSRSAKMMSLLLYMLVAQKPGLIKLPDLSPLYAQKAVMSSLLL